MTEQTEPNGDAQLVETDAAELSKRWAMTLPQVRAVELVFRGELELNDIAAALGIDRTTLWRWRRRPEFNNALAELADEALGEAILLLKSRATDIVRRMLAALKDPDARGDKAAETLLRFLFGDPSRAQVLVNQQQQAGGAVLTSADLEKLAGEIDDGDEGNPA